MHTKTIPDTLLFSQEDIRRVMPMKDIVDIVDKTFVDFGEGGTVNPTKLTLDLGESSPYPPYEGFMNAMPAYIGWQDIAGLKWVGGFTGERRKAGLPFITAMILLLDPHMGNFIAAMDGTYITNMRTGAQTAVALKYLLNKKSIRLGLFGAGMQGHTQTMAIAELFAIDEVRVYDVYRPAAEKYAQDMQPLVSGNIRVCDTPMEAADGDAVITVTQSKEPFLKKEWLRPGTVLLPLGSYQECENDALLGCDKIVVDHVGQALHRGALKELNRSGRITEAHITATIGELAAGKTVCVLQPDEKILCIPIGTGALDIAVAGVVYDRLQDTAGQNRFRFSD